jgi:hypothetical protein
MANQATNAARSTQIAPIAAGLIAGGQGGAAECTRMVLEKIDAGEAAHTAGALALVEGKGVEAATKLAMAPIKRRVRANHLRLLRG